MLNIWSGTRTKCVNFMLKGYLLTNPSQCYVMGNNFSYENKELWLTMETLIHSHQAQVYICLEWNYWEMLFGEIKLESNSFSVFANNDNFTNVQYVFFFVAFCILLPTILLANPTLVWGHLMSVKSLKLENWKLC